MLITVLVEFSIKRPKALFLAIGFVTLLAVVQFFRVTIDTDPENMLPADEPVRVFHHEVQKEFSLYDYIVLGVVNEDDPRGVFNPQTLEDVYRLTGQISGIEGVIAYELMSLANKDDIQQDGAGAINFRWLMGKPPYDDAEAGRIRTRALENPLFYNTLISEDAKALAVYVPIKEKKQSYRITREIRALTAQSSGSQKYYFTGLPLAEDAFGHEMFVQMGISAPLALIVIFLLMLYFFRHLQLVLVPLIMAMLVVIITMGLLVGCGFPIHIMSSMIPIFLLPISVLDSIHILSEFFEEYKKFGDKAKTISHVLHDLYKPNLFTSLTTMAGFVSLAFAPIPPVQVFGVFVAIGVGLAWVLTVTLIPAYVVLMKGGRMSSFGASADDMEHGLLNRFLRLAGRFTTQRWRIILAGTLILVAVSLYGISRIRINDNPTRWFSRKHPIRVADIVLNEHFGGTYSAYLILEAQDKDAFAFQDPQMLRYIERLQQYLFANGLVGKSTTVADVVKKVYYELLGGDTADSKIPDTPQAVAQTLLSFENSHKPDDLWHFVTPDYSKANVWLQLRSGDNKDMAAVVRQVDEFLKENPAPAGISERWAGLTYINMIWQDRMVGGMLVNFIGSFIIVLFMMTVLFRSPMVGLMSMVPLAVTILFIYSALGFIGKDYDMPVAVLSALTLGLAVDFAIHFIQRSKEIFDKQGPGGSWSKTVEVMFGSPARALFKNALVISIGFLPLFVSPLVPYRTVGFFMFMIMLTASVGTLLILPALMTCFSSLVFEAQPGRMICSCRKCIFLAVFVAATVVYVLLGYSLTSLNVAGMIALAVVVLMSGVCFLISKRSLCQELQKGSNR